MPAKKKKTSSEDFTTLLGGESVTVTLRNGKTETVFVSQFAVRKLPLYIALLGDEAALIELVCDKEKGWADNLTIESHTELIEKADELNFKSAEAWMNRRKTLAKEFRKITAISSQASSDSAAKPPSASASP